MTVQEFVSILVRFPKDTQVCVLGDQPGKRKTYKMTTWWDYFEDKNEIVFESKPYDKNQYKAMIEGMKVDNTIKDIFVTACSTGG